MKLIISLFTFIFVTLTANAGPMPLNATYCGPRGDTLTVITKNTSQIEAINTDLIKDIKLILHKSNITFQLHSDLGTYSTGGNDSMKTLETDMMARQVLQKNERIVEIRSFGIVTLNSPESTVRTIADLTEAKLASGDRVARLEASGTVVFLGTLETCQ